jgi:hypothetical protein
MEENNPDNNIENVNQLTDDLIKNNNSETEVYKSVEIDDSNKKQPRRDERKDEELTIAELYEKRAFLNIIISKNRERIDNLENDIRYPGRPGRKDKINLNKEMNEINRGVSHWASVWNRLDYINGLFVMSRVYFRNFIPPNQYEQNIFHMELMGRKSQPKYFR